MRSGLLFKLAMRKPNIFLNDKHLYGYTFLESSYLDHTLAVDPLSEPNKSIIQFLKTPFDIKQLEEAKFLRSNVEEHLNTSARIQTSIKTEKNKLFDNLNQMSQRNIIDLAIWKDIFREVLDERFDELQDHPHLDEAFKHMQAFFSRFDIKNSKFYLDRGELSSLFTLKENCTSIYNVKKNLGSIRLQTSLMNFFTKASSKVHVNLEKMRNYYAENLIKRLPEILSKQSNIVDVAKLQTVLDALYLSNDNTRQIFSQRINTIFSQQKQIKINDNRQYLIVATNWACIGQMRPSYERIFKQTFDALLFDSPAALLQAVVTCHKQTPELLDEIFKALIDKNFDQLSRKPEIHRVLHILSIRGVDLSKYQSFVTRIAEQNCEHLSETIAQKITTPIKSDCMRSINQRQMSSFSPNIQYKWISNLLKSQFSSKLKVFCQTKVCRFDIMFGFVKNDKIYVVEIPNMNLSVNKPRNYRGTIQQKKELFKYYNITILQLQIPFKHLNYILHKKDKAAIIKAVKALIQSV